MSGGRDTPDVPWRLDELGSAGRENLDPAHVERYDEKEEAEVASELELVRSIALREAPTVVEFGPGTGQLGLVAAESGWPSRWIAVDVSAPMLAELERGRSALGAHAQRLELVNAGFLSYEHEGEPADLVYSRLALHHLPDFWKALALTRARSILRPGGALRLADIAFGFDPGEAEGRIEAWRAQLPVEGGAGEWVRADIDEHVREEHSTFTWLLEPMIERAGFAIEAAEYSDDGIWARYVARAV